MEIQINKASGVPLYLQVKKQIMDLIRNGSLKVGTKMPTERELSEKLKMSRNTISSAYKELEQDGVLKSYQGRGTFVAEEVHPWQAKNVKDKIIKFVDLGLEEALETGMDAEEFLEIVSQRVKEKVEMMSKIVAVYVECNIEQSKMFSKQLSQSTNMNVIPLTLSDLKTMDENTKNTIEKSQVIIATFNHVNEVSEITSSFNKDVLGIAINADLGTIVKIARYPQETRFGFICISQEFMFKIRGALEKAGLGNIDIEYSNTIDESEIRKIVDRSDVIIVSPGRYKDVVKHMGAGKEIIQFLYSLDDGSVKALKSKIVELKYIK
jgi:DNA-binding transcriptional regulator YhcF (GntR family)